MGAGSPDWRKLRELNKLPKDQEDRFPEVVEKRKAEDQLAVSEKNVEDLEKRIEEIKREVCDDCRAKVFSGQGSNEPASGEVEVKCPVEGCEYVAKGRTEGLAKNTLRMHNRSHEQKP